MLSEWTKSAVEKLRLQYSRFAPFFNFGEPRMLSPRMLYSLWGIFFALCVMTMLWISWSVQAPGTIVAANAKRFIPGVCLSIYVLCALTVVLYLLVYRLQYTKRQAKITQLFAAILIAVMLLIALGIHPTRSQDIYWNLLLARGATEHHLNPYTTTPNMLVRDSWSASVPAWRTQTMSHGVLWTLPLMGIASLTDKLVVALVYTKIFLYIGLISVYVLLWKILLLHDEIPLIEKRKLWIFFALQPLWFQFVAIDMHNDVWVAVSILAAVLFLKKENYHASAVALVLGGCVKYVPLFLLPIPLWLAWKEAGSIKTFARAQRVTIALLCISAVLFFTVQFSLSTTPGLYTEIFDRGRADFLLVGSQFVSFIVGGNEIILRIVGLLLMALALAYYIRSRRYMQAFIIPFVVLLTCGTPWFQSWYALWIAPLLWIVAPPVVVAILAMALLLMYEIIMPADILGFVFMCCLCIVLLRACGVLWLRCKKYVV